MFSGTVWLTGLSGSGWSCTLSTLTCTSTANIGIGSNYNGITLTVADGPGTDLDVYGTVEILGTNTISASADVVVNSGGILAPGPAIATLRAGNTRWIGAGNYNWKLYDAAGSVGTGFDSLQITGTLDVSAAAGFAINISSLSDLATPGPALNFDSALAQSWIHDWEVAHHFAFASKPYAAGRPEFGGT